MGDTSKLVLAPLDLDGETHDENEESIIWEVDSEAVEEASADAEAWENVAQPVTSDVIEERAVGTAVVVVHSELVVDNDITSVWSGESDRILDAEAMAVKETVGSLTDADSRTLALDMALSEEFDVKVKAPVAVADELVVSEAPYERVPKALAVTLNVGSIIDAVRCLLSL